MDPVDAYIKSTGDAWEFWLTVAGAFVLGVLLVL